MKAKVVRVFVLIGCLCLIATAIFLGVYFGTKKKEEPETFSEYYNTKCNAFTNENAHLLKNQIVFIGDSITDFYHLDDFYADLSLETYNRGIAGDTTYGVLNRLKLSLFDICPSKVVLMIGTNDVGARSVSYIMDKYKKILKEIKTNLPSAEVYCMSIIAQNNIIGLDVGANNQKINQINPQIKTLAESMGYKYYDLHSLTTSTDGQLNVTYTNDGIHLNDAGFEVWTNLIKPDLI